MAKWDRGLDFEEALRMLASYKSWLRSSPAVTAKRRLALRNVNILLLALANGLRISEAVECYSRWLENPQLKEIPVRAAKTKRERYRMCYTDPLDDVDYQLTRDLPRPTPNALQSWAQKRLKINTHTLRAAHIRHAAQHSPAHATTAKPVPPAALKILAAQATQKRISQATAQELRENQNSPS
jgi:integrase